MTPPTQPEQSMTVMKNKKTHLSCLCGAITQPSSIIKHLAGGGSLPIPSELCHCDTCRRSTGAMCAFLFELVGPPPPTVLAGCDEYVPAGSKVARYFCRNCGSQMFVRGVGVESDGAGSSAVMWLGWAGTVRVDADGEGEQDEDVVATVDTNDVAVQFFVNNTKDGGVVRRMVEVATAAAGGGGGTETDGSANVDVDVIGASNGLLAQVHDGRWDEPAMTSEQLRDLVTRDKKTTSSQSQQPLAPPSSSLSSSSKLLAKCHCGNVQFHIAKPNTSSQQHQHQQHQDLERAKEHVGPDGTKYLVKLCVCWSCTSSTGNTFQPWIYVQPEDIVTVEDGTAIDFWSSSPSTWQPPPPPTSSSSSSSTTPWTAIKQYQSSAAVRWSFCRTCGATVFGEWTERPWLVNISVGILRSDRGALAEDFLDWNWDWDLVIWRDECRSTKLLRALTRLD